MAIIKNRSKEKSAILKTMRALPRFYARIAAIFFILLSLQLIYLGSQKRLRGIIFDASGYVTEAALAGYGALLRSIESVSKFILDLTHLREENIALKLELSKLRNIEDFAVITYKENESLKSQLHLIQDLPYQSIPGRLISISTTPYSKSAMVRVDSSLGIEVGQVVVNSDGVVGRISEVGQHYSRILLITDFGSRIPVISNFAHIHAVVAGNGAELCDLLYIRDSNEIKLGEILVTSGDGKYYPPGLKVAKISSIIGREIHVTPTAHPYSADFVNIIKIPTSSE